MLTASKSSTKHYVFIVDGWHVFFFFSAQRVDCKFVTRVSAVWVDNDKGFVYGVKLTGKLLGLCHMFVSENQQMDSSCFVLSLQSRSLPASETDTEQKTPSWSTAGLVVSVWCTCFHSYFLRMYDLGTVLWVGPLERCDYICVLFCFF